MKALDNRLAALDGQAVENGPGECVLLTADRFRRPNACGQETYPGRARILGIGESLDEAGVEKPGEVAGQSGRRDPESSAELRLSHGAGRPERFERCGLGDSDPAAGDVRPLRQGEASYERLNGIHHPLGFWITVRRH